MKKTIAILLVLVLAGVGLFAAPPTHTTTTGTAIVGSTDGTTANLVVKTKVTGEALFGLSVGALVTADYASSEAFQTKVSGALEQNFASADDLIGANITLGYISGFNTTSTGFGLSIGITPLTNGTAIIPVLYTVGTETTAKVLDDTNLAKLKVEPAGAELGKLESTLISVTGAKTDIDLAPEGTYSATITFTATTY